MNFKVHRVRFYEHQPVAVHCMSYSPALRLLSLSRADGSIEIWSEDDNWYCTHRLPAWGQKSVEALCWCKQNLFSAGLFGDVTLYDLQTVQPKISEPSNAGPVWCLAANEEKGLIAAGTEEGCVVLFDVSGDSLMYLRAFNKQDEGRMLCLSWAEDGSCLVSGGTGKVRVWSLTSGQCTLRLSVPSASKRRPTLVWSVLVLRDFTIATGDSRGVITLWSGREGDVLQTFQSHKADVMTMCSNEHGTVLFAAGVDPCVVRLDYVTASQRWAKTDAKTSHSHDVRALLLTTDTLVSAGVDGSVNIREASRSKRRRGRFFARIPPLPVRPVCSVCSRSETLLLHYPTRLELWRLGSAAHSTGASGSNLPLRQQPVKLLELSNRRGLQCSALAPDAAWIAAVDATWNLRLYQIALESPESPSPRVSLHRVRLLPQLPAVSIVALALTSEVLVCASSVGSLLLLKLDAIQPMLLAHVQPPSLLPGPAATLQLCVSPCGKLAALCDSARDVHVYYLQQHKHKVTLPRQDVIATALHFSDDSRTLLVAYADRKLIEYSLEALEYTKRSRRMQAALGFTSGAEPPANASDSQWSALRGPVRCVSSSSDVLLAADASRVLALDHQQESHGDKQKRSRKRRRSAEENLKHNPTGLHLTEEFKYVIYAQLLARDSLLVLERTPEALADSLPPALLVKKFGT